MISPAQRCVIVGNIEADTEHGAHPDEYAGLCELS